MRLWRKRKRKVLRYEGVLDTWEGSWTSRTKKWAVWLESNMAHWSTLQRLVAYWLFVLGCAGVCGWTVIDNLLKLIK